MTTTSPTSSSAGTALAHDEAAPTVSGAAAAQPTATSAADPMAVDRPAHTRLRAHQLELDGRLTFVQEWGPADGLPVLAIHTAGQSGVQYRDAARELAAHGYRVIVPDMPGHGHSEQPAGGPVTDLGDYAAFCIRVLDALEVTRPVVVGCSIGGKIALDVGIRLGDGVRAVVAMAANADRGHVNVKAMRRELNDISTPSRSDRTYWGTRAVVGGAVPEARREIIARMHRREDPDISHSDLIGWGTHDIIDRLPEITAPAHLVAGSGDLWIDPETIRRAAAQIPGAQFTLLEGIGHYPMEEMADFAPVLHGWIQDALSSDTRQDRGDTGGSLS
ncbi:alpha/beta fold hydrolase [Brevibacterium jeotgali]|uniref:Pimeloyl-ACP methyl ester carboxylesterase n=1 Tax=Brevibacterium jeotgali TaxID=1262550 RepID=A0A2H1L1I4_9MICO|nr:alpha/beta hydrolase [Brevibacterium jeotgali]TWC01873.1 pimeloyl-ACP methyl ester carboxylesterase [Brevibacterium jeotgali]SMY10776.1 Pimeloyl-ACP methyl ester carboxylesterase [Brevibacterium jeotgali]